MQFDDKLQSLTRVIVSSIETTDEIASMSHSSMGTDESQLIIAEESSGAIKMARVDLHPVFRNGLVEYQVKTYPTKVVKDRLIFFSAGMDDIALNVLNGIGPAIAEDPIIDKYRSEVARNKGTELSLAELEQLGADLVQRSAAKYKAEIGLPIQMATIENGISDMVKQPFPELPPYLPPTRISGITFKTFGGGAVGGKGWFVFETGLQGGGSMKAAQHLDGIYVFSSRFENCILLFEGDPNSIFDSSNLVSNSELIVRAEDQMKSPFIVRFKNDFPKVAIHVDPSAFRN